MKKSLRRRPLLNGLRNQLYKYLLIKDFKKSDKADKATKDYLLIEVHERHRPKLYQE